MRNLKLYDGSVRCADHFDASSYESLTDEPCTYGVMAGVPCEVADEAPVVEQKRAHQYADPCVTCGEPSYDYNIPKCSRCQRAEERDMRDPLSRMMFPGAASALAAFREANAEADTDKVEEEAAPEKIIGDQRGDDARCLAHVDYLTTGESILEGTDFSCTYCGDAWKDGLTPDERYERDNNVRHCDHCLTYQPTFEGDVCPPCAAEKEETEACKAKEEIPTEAAPVAPQGKYRTFKTEITDGVYVITETGATDSHPMNWSSLDGKTRETSWQHAQSQALPVRFVGLDGTVQDLGVRFAPQAFEERAYSGYVSAGIGGTDGYYAPEDKATWVRQLRKHPEHYMGHTRNHAAREVRDALPLYLAALESVGLRKS